MVLIKRKYIRKANKCTQEAKFHHERQEGLFSLPAIALIILKIMVLGRRFQYMP